MTEFKLISPVCSQHKLFLETHEEELTLDGIQVKPGDALSSVVVPVWSKITLHSVVARDGQTIVWRLFSVETDLSKASDAQAAKDVLEGLKKMAAAALAMDEVDENGEIPTTGEAPVAEEHAPEQGN